MSEFGIRPPGFRLPGGTHVGRVRLQVADAARSLDYYTDVLGLDVKSHEPGRVRLGPHEDDRIIVELVERIGARPVPRGGRLGLYHFAILLPDRRALGRFVEHLSSRGERAGMADHSVSEALYLYDPDGLGIEVYADRPRGQWLTNGKQVHMTTEPLDASALAAAGEGDPWAGMPRGTVIGHVHLSVGDLREAESFYHSALGLDKTVWDYPGALFLSAGGYHHHLGTNTWSAGAPRAGAGDARLVDWELCVPDGGSEQAASSLERAGVALERRDGRFSAIDPWGTRVLISPARP